MGYNTHVTGEFRVTPRLDQDLSDFRSYFSEDYENELFAENMGEEETVGLVNGEITVIPGDGYTSVQPRFNEPHKAYELESDVQEFLRRVKAHGNTVNGVFKCYGEEDGDIARIRIEDNAYHSERPTLRWPNGDEEPLWL